MRCQLTVAPALPTAAAAVSSFRCSSQSNGHANDTIAPADHALQRLRIAMPDEVVENLHDAAGTGIKRARVVPKVLLQLHLILDRLHAADGARYLYRVVDIFARAHEAAQLNVALERLDVDLGALQTGLIEDR